MTRAELFYHLTTKFQQMLWSEPESTHHNPACVCEPENSTRTIYEWKKPPIVNQQCLFIEFNATCVMQSMLATHADIYTNRVKGHNQQSSAIAKHYKNVHDTMPQDLLRRFEEVKKCRDKCDFLVHEMLFISALKPNLNVQSDSLHSSESIFIIFAHS